MEYQSFTESDLQFSFSSDWVVKKYDDHAYYKVLAGHGLKGVDFIGIYKGESLYLIEVKNYKQRKYSPVAANWSDLEGITPPLVKIYMRKIDDSLKLIRVVMRAFKRKWWSRLLFFVQEFLGDTRLDKDWKFWKKVYELSTQASTVYSILWLEVDPNFLVQEHTNETKFLKRIYTLVGEQTDYEIDSFSVLSVNTKAPSLLGVEVSFEE